MIYLSGWGDSYSNALVRYNPVLGTLTNLATAPGGVVGSEANIVLVP